jgi:TRAP-type transport system periplasmic protein
MHVFRHNNNKISQAVFIISMILFSGSITFAQAQVFKIATVSPDGAMWMKKMRAGGTEIAERTQGRVKFKFYPGGVMGNSQSVMRKIRFGQLQGGAFTAGSLAKVYPDIQIYALPLLFASQEEVDYVRARMDTSLLQGLEQQGFVSFGFAGGGFAYTMSVSPQNSMQDLRAHKLWVPAGDIITSTTMQVAGISPIPLPLSEVLTGLQTGMIDTVAISPVGAIAFQWYTKANYFMDYPLNYIYALLVIDKKAFDKIDPADQKIVRQIMSRIYQEIDQQNRLDNKKAREVLRQQGVTFVKFSPDLLADWKKFAKKSIQLLGEKGAFSPAMFNTLQKHLQQLRQSTE